MRISKKILANLVRKLPVLWLAGLLVLVFAVGAIKQILAYNEEGSKLMREHYQMTTLVSKKQTWELRSNWITQDIPRFETEEKASKFLTEKIKLSLVDYELDLESYRTVVQSITELLNAEKKDNFDRTILELKLSGEERKVVAWLHELQRPGNFAGYDNLVIKLDEFGLVCEVRVTQWYRNSFRPSSMLGENLNDSRSNAVLVSEAF